MQHNLRRRYSCLKIPFDFKETRWAFMQRVPTCFCGTYWKESHWYGAELALRCVKCEYWIHNWETKGRLAIAHFEYGYNRHNHIFDMHLGLDGLIFRYGPVTRAYVKNVKNFPSKNMKLELSSSVNKMFSLAAYEILHKKTQLTKQA